MTFNMKFCIKISVLSIILLFGYKSLYGFSSYLNSDVIHQLNNQTVSPTLHKMIYNRLKIITLEPSLSPSVAPTKAPHPPEPCDEADKKRKRAVRYFNESKVGKCLHSGYHRKYYDDIVNTFTAAVNILYEINVTFAVVQGTLLSVLRNQPLLPWDTDADLYLVLDDSRLDEIVNSNNTVNHEDINHEDIISPFDDTQDYYDSNFYHDYGGFGGWYDGDNTMEKLYLKVKNATEKYKSNAKHGNVEYKAVYDINDAPNIIRFLKKEVTNWGCSGYTDIYVITIDEWSHTYYGGDAGRVAHESVNLDYLFPIKHYQFRQNHWSPHWKSNFNEWNGETLNRDTIPIPNKPHELSELAYPNHTVPDNNGSILTCESKTKPFKLS